MCPGLPEPSDSGFGADGVPVRVLANRPIAETNWELILTRPDRFVWQAGQRIPVCLDGRCREYSLASGEADNQMRLLIHRFDRGTVSPQLCRLTAGRQVHVGSPRGYFQYRSVDREAIFVATGTGVAPFAAMARSGKSGFTLLHGVRDENALYAAAELKAAAACYVPCITGGHGDAQVFAGRVTDYLALHLAPGAFDFYLCGKQRMIRDAALVVDDRFPGSRVFTEAFY